MPDSTQPQGAHEHTLPASWWVSPKIFDLERRAIFSKAWLYATHRSRLNKPGDYLSFDIAGFPFFVILGKDDVVRAFHNVCRHRAYPVVRKETGSSTVLGCRYHGWSYNTKGDLVKAPQFDNVPGFNKEANGLFEIRTYQTKYGHIFVNFDASEEGPIPFDEWYGGLQSEMEEFNWDDYEYRESWSLDGKFNWKTLMDGYQECYHCPTAHPGLSKAFKMPTYKVTPKGNWARHWAEQIKAKATPVEIEQEDAGSTSSWFGWGSGTKPAEQPKPKEDVPENDFNGLWMYVFPINAINCYGPMWYTMRVTPKSAGRTVLEYDFYMKKGLSDQEAQDFITFLKQVEQEDYDLCEATQKNLAVGVYATGQLHPVKENGVLFYQDLVKKIVLDHVKLEKEKGREIFPAYAGLKYMGDAGLEADMMCKDLECGAGNTGILAW